MRFVDGEEHSMVIGRGLQLILVRRVMQTTMAAKMSYHKAPDKRSREGGVVIVRKSDMRFVSRTS